MPHCGAGSDKSTHTTHRHKTLCASCCRHLNGPKTNQLPTTTSECIHAICAGQLQASPQMHNRNNSCLATRVLRPATTLVARCELSYNCTAMRLNSRRLPQRLLHACHLSSNAASCFGSTNICYDTQKLVSPEHHSCCACRAASS